MEEEKIENLSQGMASPTDEIIKNAIFEWLETVDVSTVTKKDLKNELERRYEWNLNEKKSLLSEALMEFYEQKMKDVEEEEVPQGDDGGGDEDRDEEEGDGEGDKEGEEEDENEEDQEDDTRTKKRQKRSGKATGFQAPVQLSTKLSQFLDGAIFLRRPEVREFPSLTHSHHSHASLTHVSCRSHKKFGHIFVTIIYKIQRIVEKYFVIKN